MLLAVFAAGCGSSSNHTGQVRFFHASASAPNVNLLIDGATVSSNLAYGNTSGYISAKAGARRLEAVPVNSTSPILDLSVSITENGDSTVLMTGSPGSLQSMTLTDGGTTASTGNGYVRAVNASVSMGAADVYIVAAGSGIGSATPVATNLSLNQSAGYHLTAAGNYELFMTSPSTHNVLLDTGPINLASGQNWTLVALDGPSGGFTFSLLQDQ
jgi:hypothetical protein